MSNFKIGDTVKRTSQGGLGGLSLGQQGVVSDVGEGGKVVRIKGLDGWLHLASTLEHAEQDDLLPPAPESGVYFNHNNSRKATLTVENGVVALGVDGTARKVRLTAETALVLAHDLTRMAMAIKRKEKQNDS